MTYKTNILVSGLRGDIREVKRWLRDTSIPACRGFYTVLDRLQESKSMVTGVAIICRNQRYEMVIEMDGCQLATFHGRSGRESFVRTADFEQAVISLKES